MPEEGERVLSEKSPFDFVLQSEDGSFRHSDRSVVSKHRRGEADAFVPEWLHLSALEEVHDTFLRLAAQPTPVVRGILVAVSDVGSTVEQLAVVALLSGVRQRCAEGGEYFFQMGCYLLRMVPTW